MLNAFLAVGPVLAVAIPLCAEGASLPDWARRHYTDIIALNIALIGVVIAELWSIGSARKGLYGSSERDEKALRMVHNLLLFSLFYYSCYEYGSASISPPESGVELTGKALFALFILLWMIIILASVTLLLTSVKLDQADGGRAHRLHPRQDGSRPAT